MHDGYYWEELPPMAIAREGIACSAVNLPMSADKSIEVGISITYQYVLFFFQCKIQFL